ncbi:hypothetical protein DLAC_00682 [Tieghemostelium lacteum]|nr:hypothetical protein DLAC_00682 [Tieghemostelium lacteum]|eukprot:KYR02548.1 hypothetical protein DLAC_00682 [Tieghemostelium lacteum]
MFKTIEGAIPHSQLNKNDLVLLTQDFESTDGVDVVGAYVAKVKNKNNKNKDIEFELIHNKKVVVEKISDNQGKVFTFKGDISALRTYIQDLSDVPKVTYHINHLPTRARARSKKRKR